MKSIRERYHSDPAFYSLVNALYSFIQKAEFTPTEIREAAMLAQIKYEETNPRPLTIFEREEIARRK